jgi:hypothetical protein
MNRYKVTSTQQPKGIILQGKTEDEAWQKACKMYSQHHGGTLTNGKVEQIPTEADKDAKIAELTAALNNLLDIDYTCDLFTSATYDGQAYKEFLAARRKAKTALSK